MEYAVFSITIVVAIFVGVALLKKYKKTNTAISFGRDLILSSKKDGDLINSDSDFQELMIRLETLPAESIPDQNKLVAITDSTILARVNNLVPELAQIGNSARNTVQAVKKSGEVLYKVVIPNGAKLADSKSMHGAVRGFYRGADGIRGHANLVAQQAVNGTEIVSNAVSSAMNVGSMIVGQYYMAQIHSELEAIGDEIGKISDFQNNEFRSRVFSLVAHAKTIADFQIEILENDELRQSKISQLDSLEEECTKLLGQANLTLVDFTKKNDLDFETYEKQLRVAQQWYMYQKTLMEVLYRISDLRYTLHLGRVSREQCNALIPTYANQEEETQKRLTRWHDKTIERLKIDMSEIRRKRDGFDGVIHFLPGLFNDEYNFKSISTATVEMIHTQLEGHASSHARTVSDLYSEDVQLIIKDNKVYYLPETE